MKRFWMITAVGALGLVLAGCNGGGQASSSATDEPASAESTMPADDAIKVDQIDYKVSSGVVNGNRRAVFSYTNNSDYTVVGVQLEMVFPDDVETEELEGPFGYLLEKGTSMDDLLESTMECDDEFVVEPGDSSRDNTFSIRGYYVLDPEQFEVMQPDLMTIRFLSDGLIYEEYYDYRNDSYSLSSDIIDPEQWGDGDLSAAVPRPQDSLVVDTRESDTQFSFEISGMTRDAFDSYVDECIEAGYTVDVAQTDSSYYADNEEGTYHIDLIYMDDSGRLDGFVEPIKGDTE